jgi:hypothetical protein
MVDHICEPILSTPFASSELRRPPQDGGKTAYVENMAVLRKQRDDERDWCHFAPFKVARSKRSLLARISSRILRSIKG